jgi:fatty acid synthase, animal type
VKTELIENFQIQLENRTLDSEYCALLNCVHEDKISGHLYRGFSVLHPGETGKAKLRDNQHYPGAKRPIWFVFAGMGSQWSGMGRDLLKIPTFALAIDKCDAVLKPKGLDIRNIITSTDPKMFDNILNAFVGIAAIQVNFCI